MGGTFCIADMLCSFYYYWIFGFWMRSYVVLFKNDIYTHWNILFMACYRIVDDSCYCISLTKQLFKKLLY